MKCSEFESELARLLANATPDGDVLADAERLRLVEQLREHVRRCMECDATAELLELAVLPPAERARTADPGAAYWERFDTRVMARLAEAPGAAPPWRRWAAVAALFLLAAALFVVGTTRRQPSPGPGPDAGKTATASNVPLPESLDRMLDAAPEGELLDELDFLAGFDGVPAGEEEEDGWLFPDIRDLDPELRDELLLWLEEQSVDERGVSS